MRKATALVLCSALLVALIAGFVAPQASATKALFDCTYTDLGEGVYEMCCYVDDPDCQCSYEECFFVIGPQPVEEN